MKLSLVIPCYNEALNLPLLIERCLASFSDSNHEVILVDNGSTDNSEEVLQRFVRDPSVLKVVKVETNQGYGHGILAGLAVAQGDVVAWTHADLQTDPADAITGLDLFERSGEPDLLFVKGIRYGRPLADRFFTFGMSVFETLLLGVPLWDINAQPTMFHRSFLKQFENSPDDFSLDLFGYYIAARQGLNIERIPVRFGERAYGVSHWNIDWKSKIKFIQRTLSFSFELRKKL
jgi:glycosyltransferase involved in cell wall biosynthesis